MDTSQFKVINKVESLVSGTATYTFTLQVIDPSASGTFSVSTTDPLAATFYTIGGLYNVTVAPAV